MEVMNILKTKTQELYTEEKFPIIKILEAREGLQLIQTITNPEKETCKNAE